MSARDDYLYPICGCDVDTDQWQVMCDEIDRLRHGLAQQDARVLAWRARAGRAEGYLRDDEPAFRCGECGGRLIDHRCADCGTRHGGNLL